MSASKCLHIRTGQRALAEQVDSWLAQAGSLSVCDNPYDAAAHILTNSEDMPDLAVIGLDWLDDHEISLLNRIREVWPGIVVIAYGLDVARVRTDSHLTRVCRGHELSEWMAQTPDSAVAAIRRGQTGGSVALEGVKKNIGQSLAPEPGNLDRFPPRRQEKVSEPERNPSKSREQKISEAWPDLTPEEIRTLLGPRGP